MTVILDRRVKPLYGQFRRDLLNNQWDDFWAADPKIALLFNEKHTSYIRNYAFPEQRWQKGGAAAVDLVLGDGTLGPYVQSQFSSYSVAEVVPVAGDPVPPNPGPFTSVFAYCEDVGALQGNGEFIGNSSSRVIKISSARNIVIRLASSDRFTSTGTVPASGPFSIGAVIKGGGPYRVYINGLLDSEQASDSAYGNLGAINHIGGVSSAGARTAKLTALYVWRTREVPAHLFMRLHQDPFGPFRLDYELGRRQYYFVPAGGGPVAKTATDGLDVGLAGAAALLAALGRSDQLDTGLGESPAILGALARSDQLDLSLAEAAGLTARLARADGLDLSIAEASAVAVSLSAADQLDLGLAEAAAILAALARGDTLDAALAEAVSIAGTVAAADGLDLAVDDAAAVLAALAAADTLDPSLAEAGSVLQGALDAVIRLAGVYRASIALAGRRRATVPVAGERRATVPIAGKIHDS